MKMLEGVEQIFELTPLQQGMLFHTLYAPESSVYNIQLEFALEGDLEEGALEQAWRLLVQRYAPLRTSFVWERVEKPYQVVHRGVDLKITRHDWRELTASEQDQRRKSFLEQDRARLFDLTWPPLMRLALIVLAERKFRLVWTFHHIILEGWSAAIVLDDFWKLYGNLRSGRPADLPPVHPYLEYIHWLQRQDQAKAEAYWRETLRGFSAPTRLPIDRSAGSAPAGVRKANWCSATLSKEFSDSLMSLSRTSRVTLNTIVQGAWSILLSRYSGEPDVVFGAVVSGRPAELPGAESMVGLFVNTLPARVNVDGDRQVMPWLQQIQLAQAGMRQYEYSSLMQVQAWSEVRAGQPLFHTALAFENWLGDFPSGQVTSGLGVTNCETDQASDQPLALVVEVRDSLKLTLVYDVERFGRADIERMLGHLQTLFQGMADHPQATLKELSLLAQSERDRLLVDWNRTRREYPRAACVHELFERQVARTPEAVAIEYEDARLSYAQLNERANRLAHYLRDLGVGPDVLVGTSMPSCSAAVIAMLGILKAGGAYVPLDPEYPKERLAFMLEDAETPVVVTESKLAAGLPDTDARIVCLDWDWPVIEGCSAENPASGAGGGNLAYVIYTSGSTGTPKGVQVTHRAINRLVCNTDYVDIRPADRIAQASVMSFDAATFEIWGALLNGARVVGVPREVSLDPRAFSDFLRERGITVMFLTTALFNLMVREAPGAFQPLRYVLFGGEAVDVGSVRAVLRDGSPRHLLHVYGPTEVTTFSTWHRVTEVDEAATTVPIGRPIANTTAYVLDEHRQPVPVGVSGELYLGGDGVARGYLRRPELTSKHFVEDPFSAEPGARLYRTGDWVRYREDGAIEFIGRRDNQVKVRGFRIELGEIEAALVRHPQVREAVAMVREDEPGEKRLIAYVVGKSGAPPSAEELRRCFRASLPEYMVPAVFVPMDALPLTPNGKVDRGALPARWGEPPDERTFLAPRSEMEERIAQVWRDVLHLEKVGVKDNFFDLGGNSLLLTRVHGRLRTLFQREIRVVDLFQFPTIHLLAAHLADRKVAERGSHQEIQERAKRRRDAMNRRPQTTPG